MSCWVEHRQRLLEVAGHGPGDDGGVALGDQQAEHSPGPHDPGQGRQRGGRVVDDLEHTVAQHHVGAVGTDDVEQAGQVALPPGDRDVVLARPAVESSQGVGAGVDHGDPVAEPADPDREATGAAADVEDVARTALQDGLEPGPHHGAAGAAARSSRGRHGEPSGRRGECRTWGARWRASTELSEALSRRDRPRWSYENVGWVIRGSRGCGARACGRRP